jgi:hypothetical protein
MTSTLRIFSVLCLLSGALHAADAPVSAGEEALRDEDVYYEALPDDGDDAAGLSATAQPLAQGSYLSHARIEAVDARDGRLLTGAELFMQGSYLGRSPLTLAARVIDRPQVALGARLQDYAEGLRPAVSVPADGVVKVALAPETAARWYTNPSWIVGLGLLAASAAVYDANAPGTGLALVGGGVGIISLSQLMARWVHLPALRKKAEQWNAGPAADPGPLDQP